MPTVMSVTEADEQFEHPTQRVAAHPLALIPAQNPSRQPIKQIHRQNPPVDIHNRVQRAMRQRPQVHLCIRLPYHVRQQPDKQRRAKPHKAHKTRREEAPAHAHRHPRRRLLVSQQAPTTAGLQRVVVVPRVLSPWSAAPVPAPARLRALAKVVLARPPARGEDALRLTERVT